MTTQVPKPRMAEMDTEYDSNTDWTPQNHCECGFPIVFNLNEDNGCALDAGMKHDPQRGGYWIDRYTKNRPGLSLAETLDAHHKALLCNHCDGSESFDVEFHMAEREEGDE